MDEAVVGEFLDQTYGAALAPGLWPAVIERFADLVHAESAALIWQNQATRQGQGISARLDPRALGAYFGGFAMRHPSQRWTHSPRDRLRHFVPHIVADDDAMPKDALMRTPFYNDFMRPFDLHSVVRMGLTTRADDAAFLMVARPRRRERFADPDLSLARHLHAHLIRAFELGQRLADQSALAGLSGDLMDRSTHALMVLAEDGRLRHANAAARGLLAGHSGLGLLAGRLIAGNPAATARLRVLVGQAADSDPAARRGGSMTLPMPGRSLPLSVIVSPVRAEPALFLGLGPSVLVSVTDLQAAVPVAEQRLRDIFDLTRAESRVAIALFDGASPKEAAEQLGVSFHTVRGHLVRIYEKTGTSRQAELVRLIARVADA